MPDTDKGKIMTDIQLKIIDEIRHNASIKDTRLAQYFGRHPWTFHEEIKKSECSKKYTFYGLLDGNGGAIAWKYGETEYENPILGGVRPLTEACIMTKEDIISDLAGIFPQHKEEINKLLENIK